MKPTAMKKTGKQELTVTWDNGHVSVYSFILLRDSCPCAGCSGETVLLHEYVPPPPDHSAKGRYELAGIQLVGSYACQLQWNDGHATGIYTWEHLIENCPCPEHSAK